MDVRFWHVVPCILSAIEPYLRVSNDYEIGICEKICKIDKIYYE